jgi:hypothetical protein
MISKGPGLNQESLVAWVAQKEPSSSHTLWVTPCSFCELCMLLVDRHCEVTSGARSPPQGLLHGTDGWLLGDLHRGPNGA